MSNIEPASEQHGGASRKTMGKGYLQFAIVLAILLMIATIFIDPGEELAMGLTFQSLLLPAWIIVIGLVALASVHLLPRSDGGE